MTSSKRVVIVGGGVGGLAAAIRLRYAGHQVFLFERNDVVGGKLAVHQRDGYTFDIGPSLLTLPHLFDDVFRLADTSLDEQLDLVRLDPQFQYQWRDGTHLTVHDDIDATATTLDGIGSGDAWRAFIAHGREIWNVAERTFFAGPMSNPIDLARRMRSPRDLHTIDALRTLDSAARSTFADPRMQQWAGRYATYSGSSPDRAPATLACIAYVEAQFGCWYPMGGLGALRDALARVASEMGVEIRTSTEVVTIAASSDSVTGVHLADGERIAADIVVANTDAEHLYRDLLADTRALRRVTRADRSTSGFVLCLGVRGPTEGIGHHNVWFSDDSAVEFVQLRAGRLADDPTIYGCVSSVTDPSQAPDGCENWFLLVNTPPGADVNHGRYGDLVLDRLATAGVDLRGRIECTMALGPADFEQRYRSPGGAIYGTSSNGKRAAFTRPANRGARRGLYLVGGSSHPGGGLPLVTLSARIVANMIAEDIR